MKNRNDFIWTGIEEKKGILQQVSIPWTLFSLDLSFETVFNYAIKLQFEMPRQIR